MGRPGRVRSGVAANFGESCAREGTSLSGDWIESLPFTETRDYGTRSSREARTSFILPVRGLGPRSCPGLQYWRKTCASVGACQGTPPKFLFGSAAGVDLAVRAPPTLAKTCLTRARFGGKNGAHE